MKRKFWLLTFSVCAVHFRGQKLDLEFGISFASSLTTKPNFSLTGLEAQQVHLSHCIRRFRTGTKVACCRRIGGDRLKEREARLSDWRPDFEAIDRFNINSQLDHLQAKYVGTSHADLNRFEWAVNIQREGPTSTGGNDGRSSISSNREGPPLMPARLFGIPLFLCNYREVFLYGGQVISWKNDFGEELLFVSTKVYTSALKLVRSMLPLPYLKVGHLIAPPVGSPTAPHCDWKLTQFVLNHEGLEQVELYADYDPKMLLPFLWSSQHYTLEKAYAICNKRDLVREQVFILGRMGNSKQALEVIINKLGDIEEAIEFANMQQDDEIWEELIKQCLDKPEMVSYSENDVDCRRLHLIHFGEKFNADNCRGTCNNCSQNKSLVEKDVTEIAKQLIEVVKLTRQNFSSSHILEVYRGSLSQAVKKHGHNNIKLHGAGKALSKGEASQILHHLVVEDFIVEDVKKSDVYGSVSSIVKVNESKAYSLLTGGQRIKLS